MIKIKIGLRSGHSDNCTGAVGIVDEHNQMKLYFKAVKEVFEQYRHETINCSSNADSQNGELAEGATIANNNNVDLFISLHMNCYNGEAHGTETLVSSESSKAYPYAQRLVDNFAELGFANRGVKFGKLYEMNHVQAPNIISEICFCDSETDIAIYNKYSWNKLAHVLCNAIDENIPKEALESTQHDKGYVVTSYLPHGDDYEGVDISYILSYFPNIKCYARGNDKGIWLETEYLSIDKCNELKSTLGSWFYEIKY